MAITVSPVVPASFLPPTRALPPAKTLATIQLDELKHCLAYLRAIYIPEVQASRRIRPKLKRLCSAVDGGLAELYALRGDTFERNHALRWLTACLSRIPADSLAAEEFLQSTAALLAICAGTASAGIITRSFTFGGIQLEVTDAPFENADFGTVGMQTWGGACVLSEMLVDEPERFFLQRNADTRPIRVLELGAGTGLASLTIAKLAHSGAISSTDIVVSDNQPSVLDNLRKNIAANFSRDISSIRASFLDWSLIPASPSGVAVDQDPVLDTPFDLIVGADIVYEAIHASWIHACVARFLRQDGQFHLVIPLRDGFDAEAASIEDAFRTSLGKNSLTIVHKETIVCEDNSMKPGRPGRELEYWHFIIKWV